MCSIKAKISPFFGFLKFLLALSTFVDLASLKGGGGGTNFRLPPHRKFRLSFPLLFKYGASVTACVSIIGLNALHRTLSVECPRALGGTHKLCAHCLRYIF